MKDVARCLSIRTRRARICWARKALLFSWPWVVEERAKRTLRELPPELDRVELAEVRRRVERDDVVGTAEVVETGLKMSRGVVEHDNNLLMRSGASESSGEGGTGEACKYISAEVLRDKLQGKPAVGTEGSEDFELFVPHATCGDVKFASGSPLALLEVCGCDSGLVDRNEEKALRVERHLQQQLCEVSQVSRRKRMSEARYVPDLPVAQSVRMCGSVKRRESELEVNRLEGEGISEVLCESSLEEPWRRGAAVEEVLEELRSRALDQHFLAQVEEVVPAASVYLGPNASNASRGHVELEGHVTEREFLPQSQPRDIGGQGQACAESEGRPFAEVPPDGVAGGGRMSGAAVEQSALFGLEDAHGSGVKSGAVRKRAVQITKRGLLLMAGDPRVQRLEQFQVAASLDDELVQTEEELAVLRAKRYAWPVPDVPDFKGGARRDDGVRQIREDRTAAEDELRVGHRII